MAGILKCDQVQSDSNLSFQVAGANVAYMNSTGLQMTGGQIIAGSNTLLTASGLIYANAGIAFPATQVSSADANTLDDYEEGTFTPTLTASGYVFTHGNQTGIYTKIGNLVFFKIYMATTYSSGSGATNGTITGLPFTASGSAANYGGVSWYPDTGSAWFGRVGVLRTNPTTSHLTIGVGWSGSGIVTSLTWSGMTNSTEWEISGHYHV